MQNIVDIEKILFLDIETVPAVADYNLLSDRVKSLWNKKASFLKKGDETPKDLYHRAGIYAEFGKIICISVAYIKLKSGKKTLRLKSFFSDNESQILRDFIELLNTKFPKDVLLCAHNGKEFDFPYISRRILINGLKLPLVLDIGGKKPWEIQHIDTLELWKFGDHKHYTSLDLLSACFNLPSPKSSLSGEDVCYVYWKEKNLNKIAEYCLNDVITIAQLLMRYEGNELIQQNDIAVI